MARILVADDEKKIVSVVKGYLEHGGFAVVTIYDGQQARIVFRSERTNQVLLYLPASGRRPRRGAGGCQGITGADQHAHRASRGD